MKLYSKAELNIERQSQVTPAKNRTVDDVLSLYSGQKCYFCHDGGNNGDELIRQGSLIALKKAGLILSNNIQEAEVIVIRGGGFLNDFSMSGVSIVQRATIKSYRSSDCFATKR